MTGVSRAFVLGAGLGTRLRPLTASLPKPLVPIFGKPLITFALDHLRALGIDSFVINTHHLAPAFDRVFGSGEYHGCSVSLVHEPDLLETGGGIKNAEPFLGRETFIVYSGDVLTDIDLPRLVETHFRERNDVTMALRQTGLASSIALQDGRVVDIRGKHGVPGGYDFANVSIWNSSIFERIPPARKVSFISVLIDWIAAGARVGGVVLDDRAWFNIGSRAQYLDVHRTIFEGRWRPAYVEDPAWPAPVHPRASVSPAARMEGFFFIDAGAEVGEGAALRDTVLWPDAKISRASSLDSCIVTMGRHVAGNHTGLDF